MKYQEVGQETPRGPVWSTVPSNGRGRQCRLSCQDGRDSANPSVPSELKMTAELTQAATSMLGCMHPTGFLTIWDSLTMDTKEKLGNTLLDWKKIMFPPQTKRSSQLMVDRRENGWAVISSSIHNLTRAHCTPPVELPHRFRWRSYFQDREGQS
ncbi:hypothetical protein BDD12DRAFT_104417 [Trichophaea hybrida]|nr:hypothetical protein BDD12DRAFT_104417 [Trichophaea hybrida]